VKLKLHRLKARWYLQKLEPLNHIGRLQSPLDTSPSLRSKSSRLVRHKFPPSKKES
jgi:hypothetical protein